MTLDGGQVGQRDLGALLRTDPSVLVTLLNTLEDRDLVRRRRDPADRRRHIVEITEAGTAAASKLDAAIGCVEGELFADLTPQERETLRSLLARVRTTRDGTCDSSPTTDCRIRARARGAERLTLGAPFLQAMWRSAEGTRARPLLQEWGTPSPSRSDRTAVEAFPGLVVPVDAVAGLATQAFGRYRRTRWSVPGSAVPPWPSSWSPTRWARSPGSPGWAVRARSGSGWCPSRTTSTSCRTSVTPRSPTRESRGACRRRGRRRHH
ncbi:MarR family transcriptional regulator [Streptomyces europaeiscabiei]|uniref:MarR family transcriptional regulator n=1 Tax=Streptomyces europaeiscabiei TaxID=146819 RepID=UPI0038F7166F